jgi:hypothetical protein
VGFLGSLGPVAVTTPVLLNFLEQEARSLLLGIIGEISIRQPRMRLRSVEAALRFINPSAQLPADSTPIGSGQFGTGRILLLLPHSPDANRSLPHRRIFWQV